MCYFYVFLTCVMNFRNDFFPCLLNNIFKLMPVEVLQDNKKKTVKLLEAFTTTPSFNFGGTINIDYKLAHTHIHAHTRAHTHTQQ